MVTVAGPVVAVLLADRVSTLDAVAGLVENAAVTPVGNPDAASITLPLKGLTSAIVMLSVPLAPCAMDRELDDGVSEKLPGDTGVMVSVILVDALREPEMPLTVIVAEPVVAALLADNVSTLEAVAGFVPNAAVTPVGIPAADRVTLPLKGLTSVMVIVSVPLAPC